MAQTATKPSAPTLPPHVAEEMRSNTSNGRVGNRLVEENERVRIWTVTLAPGERLPVHKHQKDYIWVAFTAGRARNYAFDGRATHMNEFVITPGATAYNRYGPGEYEIHDLENIGDSDLVFATIEFADSPNSFLPVPNEVRQPGVTSLLSSTPIES